MEEIKFTVSGDPVGYLRMTQGQIRLLRIPRAKLYSSAVPIVDRIRKYEAYKTMIGFACPSLSSDLINLMTTKKIYMILDIFFKNKKHPDPDNIFKAFADALFMNDNRVAGSFDFSFARANPRVEVTIKWKGDEDV